jgi:hypothetical protein
MNAALADSGTIGDPVAATAERPIPQEALALLDQIPSETTPPERRLLYRYFRDRWAGAGHVVEIGPFLGGTTRAIALGMSANPALEAGARLHTFDRFASYYDPVQLRTTVAPLVERGVLDRAVADALCHDGDFLALFHALHGPNPYHRLIEAHNSPLPDRPDEVAGSTALDRLADETALGALFIDGCKSWASTQYAMSFLLPRTRVGAPVIFQDYGWYTCFWISSFTHALADALELETAADATYVFRLVRPVTAAEVRRRFALTPQAMGRPFFRAAAARLLETSTARGDRRGELIAHLHHVAALATLDRRADAAALLRALDVRRYAAFVGMIRGCIQSPTYRPGGERILWK